MNQEGRTIMKQISKYAYGLLLLAGICLFSGCGKEEAAFQSVPETTSLDSTVQREETAATTQTSQGQDTAVQEESTAIDYGPNPWSGTYIMADPNMEADPEVLDSITMTLPEDVTRHRVSNCQIDFVKNGTQVGGFLLVDIPEDMLEKASQTKEDFEVLSDHVAKQVMPDIYPAEASLWGGGHTKGRNHYLTIFVKTAEKNGAWTQYRHYIYVGEEYCYDFWIDEGWWGDSGFGIMESLSCADIKPELNEVEFAWSNE